VLVGGVASIVAVGEWVCPGRPCWTGSPLRLAQGRSVDANGLALVSQAAEQGLSEVFVAKQARPLVIFKVRCNQRGLAAAAFFHEFEKNIRLLGAQVEVSDFIDERQSRRAQRRMSLREARSAREAYISSNRS